MNLLITTLVCTCCIYLNSSLRECTSQGDILQFEVGYSTCMHTVYMNLYSAWHAMFNIIIIQTDTKNVRLWLLEEIKNRYMKRCLHQQVNYLHHTSLITISSIKQKTVSVKISRDPSFRCIKKSICRLTGFPNDSEVNVVQS